MSLEPYISEVKQENGLSYILSGAKARFDYGNSDVSVFLKNESIPVS